MKKRRDVSPGLKHALHIECNHKNNLKQRIKKSVCKKYERAPGELREGEHSVNDP